MSLISVIKKTEIILSSLKNTFVLLIIKIIEKFGLIKFYQPIPELGLGKYVPRERINTRLQAIQNNLPKGKLSGIDIGCNVGFYSIELAKKGHFMLGIEPVKPIFYTAQCVKNNLRMDNVLFSNLRLTPENIETLPSFDVCILMSVFHHWCYWYGKEGGAFMLDTVLSKTNKVIFFETGEPHKNSKRYGKNLPDMIEGPEKWAHKYFLDNGFEKVKTISDKGRYLIAAYK